MYRNRNKRHTIRDLCMWFVLIFILGGAAFGMTRYRDVKSAVNSHLYLLELKAVMSTLNWQLVNHFPFC